jgi:SAM-dependent methyltransferase
MTAAGLPPRRSDPEGAEATARRDPSGAAGSVGVRRRLGAGFGRESKLYAAHRPGYPEAAVAWLVGPERRQVLDLGAGSGSLTTSLVAAGRVVVAAEPSRAMLAELDSRGLAVPLVQSGAEALPFAPQSFDAVTVATAFHWFDTDVALPEVAAVLRPGGRLALVWNIRDQGSGWHAELADLLRAARPSSLAGDWTTDSVAAVEESALFGPLETAEFPFTQTLDRDGLMGLAASRSYVIALSAPRRRRLLESVGRLFDSVAGSDSTVELSYSARCWRAERVDRSATNPNDPTLE